MIKVKIDAPSRYASRHDLKKHRSLVKRLEKEGKTVEIVPRPNLAKTLFNILDKVDATMEQLTPQEYIKANSMLGELLDANPINTKEK